MSNVGDHHVLTAIQIKKELLTLSKESPSYSYYEQLYKNLSQEKQFEAVIKASTVEELNKLLEEEENVEYTETAALVRESMPYGKDEMGRKKEISSVPKDSAGTLKTSFSKNVICCTIL